MANYEHLDWVLQGEPWEALKKAYVFKDVHLDLSEADLAGKRLRGLPLSGADLSGAKLMGCDLTEAWLTGANLKGANLEAANLDQAKLVGADLTNANLTNAHLTNADLTNAVLVKANLSFATLVGTVLDGADMTGASIYGISAWDVKLNEKTKQLHLRVSKPLEPVITVDDLEVAQFIYMLLNNERVRHIIDTITSKVVLILGRFTPERKTVLDSVRDKLRRRNYVPVLFDFEKPSNRTTVETISTLAHMARFVIADITDAKSVLQELQAIVPNNPSVPVQPLLLTSQEEPGMFEHFHRYTWMLDVYRYNELEELLRSLDEKIIVPAELKARELAGK